MNSRQREKSLTIFKNDDSFADSIIKTIPNYTDVSDGTHARLYEIDVDLIINNLNDNNPNYKSDLNLISYGYDIKNPIFKNDAKIATEISIKNSVINEINKKSKLGKLYLSLEDEVSLTLQAIHMGLDAITDRYGDYSIINLKALRGK